MNRRTLITTDVRDTLREMRVGVGYHFDWQEVEKLVRPFEPRLYPAAMIATGQERVEVGAYPQHTRWLPVIVYGLLRVPHSDDGDPEQVAAWAIEDIERAILADETRGGLAVDTLLRATDIDYSIRDRVAVMVEFEVHYRTAWGDPGAAV